MVVRDLQQLIENASKSLIDTGQFSTGWIDRYRIALSSIADHYDNYVWPKRVFASLHYISTHLCIRYYGRKGSAAITNKESESTLGTIQLETEVFLWTEVSKLPQWAENAMLESDEEKLVSLCFGKCSPVQVVTEEALFTEWKKAYQDCLSRIQKKLLRDDEWSKWLCVALHFAAFYVDLYQQQDIDISGDRERRTSNNIDPTLVARLAERIENSRVLNLIELWLDSTSIDRNSSGVPQLGTDRHRTGQLVSVRTSTEILIQSSTEVSPGVSVIE